MIISKAYVRFNNEDFRVKKQFWVNIIEVDVGPVCSRIDKKMFIIQSVEIKGRQIKLDRNGGFIDPESNIYFFAPNLNGTVANSDKY